MEMKVLRHAGDVVIVHARRSESVYMGGEVRLPGEKTYRRGLTLSQAILAAGGITPRAKSARIGRDDGRGFLVVTRYKLKDIDSGKIADPTLLPGDRITIIE